MNQLAIDVDPGVLIPYLLRTEIFLLVFSIALTTTIFVSSIVLITITNIYRKSSRNFGKLRWKWLLLAIIIAVSTIIWIGYMEIHYNIYGVSHWESYRPHFGVIGPFIGVGFVILGTFFAKDMGDRLESEEEVEKSDFNRIPLILAVIGGLLAVIAIFTPTTTFNLPGSLTYVWMNQLGYIVEGAFPGAELWRSDLFIVLFTTALTLIIFTSSFILLTTTIVYRKESGKISALRKKWLIEATLIAVSTLTWIVYMEIAYQIRGYSHWQSYDPHFGVIGPFIGAGFIYGAFFLDKIFKRKV
jgi:hypothetical protein